MASRRDPVILGIDFGSNSSTVSYWKDDKVYSIHFGEDISKKTLPSVVALDKDDLCYVGQEALAHSMIPTSTVFRDLKKSILQGKTLYHNNKQVKVQYLLSELLLALKRKVELRVGCPVSKTVLTTPAYFRQQLKTTLLDAAKIAGLDVLRVINEPTSAALYYLNKQGHSKGNFLFVDLGGQTLDMTLCRLLGTVLDVQGNYGDPSCGYKLIEDQMVNLLMDQLEHLAPALHQYFSCNKHLVTAYLYPTAQEIKMKFPLQHEEVIQLPVSYTVDNQVWNLVFKISESQFKRCHTWYFRRLKNVYQQILKRTVSQSQITACVITGGPFNSPYMRNMLSKLIRVPLALKIDNMTAVSRGAAIYGAQLITKSKVILSDVTSLSIGLQMENGLFEKLIPSNSKIPCTKTAYFTTAKDFQTGALLKIIEGERILAKENKVLGSILVKDLEFGVRGTPVIEVRVEIDENGIIQVYSRDRKSKDFVHLKIDTPNRLSPYEIDQVKREASKRRPLDSYFLKKMSYRLKIQDLLVHLNNWFDRSYQMVPKETLDLYKMKKERIESNLSATEKLPLQVLEGYYNDLKIIGQKFSSQMPIPKVNKKPQ